MNKFPTVGVAGNFIVPKFHVGAPLSAKLLSFDRSSEKQCNRPDTRVRGRCR